MAALSKRCVAAVLSLALIGTFFTTSAVHADETDVNTIPDVANDSTTVSTEVEDFGTGTDTETLETTDDSESASPMFQEEEDGAASSSASSTGTEPTSLGELMATTTELSDPFPATTSTSTLLEEFIHRYSATTTGGSDERTTTTSSRDAATHTGTSTILSGNAIALANILNIVNANFVNSSGVVVFKNFFDTLLEDFDLRDIYASLSMCSLVSCSDDGVVVRTDSDAHIDNDIFVAAETGGNELSETGSGVIRTGNAYAGVNVVNVANTNVIDSNYLLLTLNAFEGVDGDIVFPSLENFFGGLGGVRAPIITTNDAAIANTVTLQTESGGNTTSAGSSTIETGDAHGSANVFNNINTNLAGGGNISIVFRVHGDWAGEVFGAPDGLRWMEDGMGGIYLFDSGGHSDEETHTVSVHATNTATINNSVHVVALTGDNAISGANTALISTGNAYAGANILNVANATVVGKNWILAIVNIFGDFKGNITFGRPDLWVGGQAALPSRVTNGELVTYTTTVINNGDSPATNITLVSDYDESRLAITSPNGGSDANGKITFSLRDLPPGGATEVVYTAKIYDADPGTDIANILHVAGREKDNQLADNTESVVIRTDSSRGGNGVKISLSTPRTKSSRTEGEVQGASTVASTTVNDLVILRDEPRLTIARGKEFSQKLVVTNTSDRTVPNVTLHDLLYALTGEVVRDESWDLGDILPNEEVTIHYVLTFGEHASLGTYRFSTRATNQFGELSIGNNGVITLRESLNDLLSHVKNRTPHMVHYVLASESSTPPISSTVESGTTTVVLRDQSSDPAYSGTFREGVLKNFVGVVPLVGGILLLMALFLYALAMMRANRLVSHR